MPIVRLNGLTPIHRTFVSGVGCCVGHGVVIEERVCLGKNVLIGHNVVIRPNVFIGDDVVIGHNTTIEDDVVIGDETRIQANCYITRLTRIEDKVFIGPCCCTTNDWEIASHGRKKVRGLEGVRIMHGARIGACVLLMPGVTIGRNAFVGAGSIVAKSVGDNNVIHGARAESTGVVPEEDRI